jgi:hypothetical protein
MSMLRHADEAKLNSPLALLQVHDALGHPELVATCEGANAGGEQAARELDARQEDGLKSGTGRNLRTC